MSGLCCWPFQSSCTYCSPQLRPYLSRIYGHFKAHNLSLYRSYKSSGRCQLLISFHRTFGWLQLNSKLFNKFSRTLVINFKAGVGSLPFTAWHCWLGDNSRKGCISVERFSMCCCKQDAAIAVRDFEVFLASLNDQGYLLKKGPRVFQLQVTEFWLAKNSFTPIQYIWCCVRDTKTILFTAVHCLYASKNSSVGLIVYLNQWWA